jgi:dihydroneopterin aldolase/2-amino-4-hydroxy-6-hydroxymethyldihydropteridine diphosphokinase
MGASMDKIVISHLEVFSHHGVYKEENVLGQKFLVSVEIFADLSAAAKNDDLSKSVNYGEVCHFIKKEMEQNTFKLIEALTAHLAKKILLEFKNIEKVKVQVKKPWAPILLPIETVSVEMERGWHTVYISLGSNLGNREQNLNSAIDLLRFDEECQVIKVSSYSNTKPVGEVEQGDFLNCALELRTLKSPEELLDLINEIENKLKRVRTIHWGPRTIDLDILFYDHAIINTERLTVPHPEILNREFVLAPMCEIASCYMHPIYNQTVSKLYENYKGKK